MSRPDEPIGKVRVLHCNLYAKTTALYFDIVIEDEAGHRWITRHSQFRFDMNLIEE